jgi:hypothetical protein
MTDRTEFVRYWKRMQKFFGAVMIATVAAFFLYPQAMPWLWAAILPVWLVLMLRLRCWNCGERLLKDGGSHIEWKGYRLVRHKSCGAELS